VKTLHSREAQMRQRLTDAPLERGLVTRVAFDCICLAPPLVVTEEEIDRIVTIIGEAIPAAQRDARG
jgi:adenosylmethionine-8-amino-7-oxononanoate aminotransferase